MTPLTLEKVRSLLQDRDWYGLGRRLRPLHPADAGDLLAACSFEEAVLLLRLLGGRRGQAFPYLPERRQRRLLRLISPEELTHLLSHMAPDDRTRLLGQLPAPVAHALLGRLPAPEMKQGLMLLGVFKIYNT